MDRFALARRANPASSWPSVPTIPVRWVAADELAHVFGWEMDLICGPLVARLADQSGGFRDRFARLAELPTWPAATLAEGPPEEISAWLSGLSDAAVLRYPDIAHGNPVMLVHSATAPTAILRSLPALDAELWAPSAAAAWEAAAALTAIYAPSGPVSPGQGTAVLDGAYAMDEVFARAVAHGDEHAIKFADTAADVYERTGNPAAISAAVHAVELIRRPEW
jgi:hypothetical protein